MSSRVRRASASRTLGAPTFSGDDLPELAHQVTDPLLVTYWEHNGDRLQLELSHEDQELPFVLALLCYPTPSRLCDGDSVTSYSLCS